MYYKSFKIVSEVQENAPAIPVTTSKIIFDELIKNWDGLDVFESFKIVLLDRANNIVGIKEISTGGISGTVADPRIILKYIIDTLASGVILAHNHPTGNTAPSVQDRFLTKKIMLTCSLLGVTMLDHVIVSKERYYSFLDNSELPTEPTSTKIEDAIYRFYQN